MNLISNDVISSQEELQRRLARIKIRVTQATLSRDIRELNLVKTADGYKALAAAGDQSQPISALARAVRDFLLDVRPAQNLLVLKTPPGGAQPLAAAIDAERFREVAGTIAGDDTVLVIATSRATRVALEKKIKEQAG